MTWNSTLKKSIWNKSEINIEHNFLVRIVRSISTAWVYQFTASAKMLLVNTPICSQPVGMRGIQDGRLLEPTKTCEWSPSQLEGCQLITPKLDMLVIKPPNQDPKGDSHIGEYGIPVSKMDQLLWWYHLQSTASSSCPGPTNIPTDNQDWKPYQIHAARCLSQCRLIYTIRPE